MTTQVSERTSKSWGTEKCESGLAGEGAAAVILGAELAIKLMLVDWLVEGTPAEGMLVEAPVVSGMLVEALVAAGLVKRLVEGIFVGATLGWVL